MRKRKLYLSELLLRSSERTLAVHIKSKDFEIYYDTIEDCKDDLEESYIWDMQVTKWLIASWRPEQRKYIKTLYILLE